MKQSQSKTFEEKTAGHPARKTRTKKKASFKQESSLVEVFTPPEVSQQSPMHVVYTVNIEGAGAQMFIDQLAASVKSIVDSAMPDDFINIHVLYKNFPDDAMQRIVDLSNQHVLVSAAQFNDDDMAFMQQFTKNSPDAAVRTWSGIVFARLWIPLYLKDLKRCIYLDSDTLVRESLKELWQTDLHGKMYGMAMGCIPEYGYNSGVMLMDCQKINTDSNWKSLFEHMSQFAATYMLPDQTVINRHYKDQIFELPSKFNYPPKNNSMLTDECQKAVIWHFYNGGTKPSIFSEADWCKVAWNQMFKS